MKYFLAIFDLWGLEDLEAMKAAGYIWGDMTYYYGPDVSDEERVNLVVNVLAHGNIDIPLRFGSDVTLGKPS